MRYKVHEKPFTPNQKTLSPDTENILNTMQNNFNESFVKNQSFNNENVNLNGQQSQQHFSDNKHNNLDGHQNNFNSDHSSTNTNNIGGLFSGLNSGGGIEKLLPLLMLMNRQNNVSSQSTEHEPKSNNFNMFKMLSESGLLGKNFSPDKLKLFEMLMNMNNLKNQSPTTSTTHKEQENNTNSKNKQADNNNENNNIKKQNCEAENFNETQEENEINSFETNKSVRE